MGQQLMNILSWVLGVVVTGGWLYLLYIIWTSPSRHEMDDDDDDA